MMAPIDNDPADENLQVILGWRFAGNKMQWVLFFDV